MECKEGTPAIVMEYYPTTLDKYLLKPEANDDKTKYALLYQIFDVLAFVHSKNKIHFDLKLENFLVEEIDGKFKRVILIDFGESR